MTGWTGALLLRVAAGVATVTVALFLGVGPGSVAPAAARVEPSHEISMDEPTLPSWVTLGASPVTPRRVFPDALGPAGRPEARQGGLVLVGGPAAVPPALGAAAMAVVTGPTPSAAAALLADPRLTLTPQARADLASGVVDPRLTHLLAGLLQRHTLTVIVFRSGHSRAIAGTDTVSNHFYGRAADVVAVDGEPVTPASQAARRVVLELMSSASLWGRPEIGQPWPELVGNGVFADARHLDHLHVGMFDPQGGRGP